MKHFWLPFILIVAVTAASCSSGEWKNDDGNWGRAFSGLEKPENVEVVHSYYYRSPHFTYEAMYYFELKTDEPFMDEWVKYGRCKLVDSTASHAALKSDRPDWFVRKELSNYKLWRPNDDDHSNFRIFKDTETGHYYVTDREGGL